MQTKKVTISFGSGSIATGFDSMSIEFENQLGTQWKQKSQLPANPDLQRVSRQWQIFFSAALSSLSLNNINIQAPVFETEAVTNFSSQDIRTLTQSITDILNNWLAGGSFGRTIDRLRMDLRSDDLLLVTIVADRMEIWQLPWHFWHLFADYHLAIEMFYKPTFSKVENNRSIPASATAGVNILGIVGRDPQLDLNLDFLRDLPKARVRVLEPRSTLAVADAIGSISSPDILIFNGHGDTIEYSPTSATDSLDMAWQEGIIYLNDNNPIEISVLTQEIRKAVDRGLQIAIFNCCNGLGLATQLSQIDLPYIVVMREKIPNLLAQQFLRDLLTNYSQGNNFPHAFKYARDRLKLADDSFARFANWLPILLHNPLSQDSTWEDLSIFPLPSFIPAWVVDRCAYLNRPKLQLWTAMGLSLCLSLLSLSIYTDPILSPLANWELDLAQKVQSTQIDPANYSLALIDYDWHETNNSSNAEAGISIPSSHYGKIINPSSDLVELFKKIDSAKPTELLPLGLCFDPLPNDLSSTLKTSLNCPHLAANKKATINKYLADRLSTPISFQGISNFDEKRLEAAFRDKPIVINTFHRERGRYILDFNTIDSQRLSSLKDRHSLPVFHELSIGWKWLWIFLGSFIIARFVGEKSLINTDRNKHRSIVLATIVIPVIIGIALSAFGIGVPLSVAAVVSTIALFLKTIIVEFSRGKKRNYAG